MQRHQLSSPETKSPVNRTLDEVTAALCAPSSLNGVGHGAGKLPSVAILSEIMARLRAIFFPGYFGNRNLTGESLHYHTAASLDTIHHMLAAQIIESLCFECAETDGGCSRCETRGKQAALLFIDSLPRLRDLLATDAQAAFEGDPAAKTPAEPILCYPSITAMLHHRVAHELYDLGISTLARIIAEMAHSATGIDIHPGAKIGPDFFIDHGTGVVIGETCVIGKKCRLYQGVTLGALSFPKNPDGSLTKGIPRHPILEDNVTVYAGATILGRVTIGHDAVIGGNVWLTQDVPAHAHVLQ